MPSFKMKKEELGNCRPSSLISIPGKVMEHIILETNSKYIKDMKIIYVISMNL